MKSHELKIEPEYFKPIITGKKMFEIRKNDRDYQVGDKLFLYEYKDNKYTGIFAVATISYITDFQQKEGFVVLGLENVFSEDDDDIN